jgi:cell division protein FtsA
MQNIMKCVRHSGLHTPAVVSDSIASCEAILNEDEKELGVALVDIGAGTTDLAILDGGSVVHSAVLPIGGNHITRDISIGLRTPMPAAERIKIKYGCAKTDLVRHDETIRVTDVGGRKPKTLSRQLLADIIEPRVEELFLLVQKELRASGCEELLASGLVLTGGCTNLDGMTEVAEEVTGLPVRRGIPQGIGGLIDVARSPAYATSIGLILHAIHQQQNPLYQAEQLHNFRWNRQWKRFRHWFGGVRRGFAEFF